MILKGQNLRIYTVEGGDATVVGMATNCTINLNTSTDDASHKDIVGMAAMPTVTSKSWSVSVDSLSVSDVAAILTAIKGLHLFTLMWDEASTTDNQSTEQAAFARTGFAYLSDVTFSWNDRENSTKSLTFTGVGPVNNITTGQFDDNPIAVGNYTKGQFVRLFLGSDNTTTPAKVIAGAKSLSFHVSMTLESSSTKDLTGDWEYQEPTALNFDISTSALVRSDDTITSSVEGQELADLEEIYSDSSPVKFQIATVNGDNNRTKQSILVSGSVILASLTVNGPNRANADYTASLNGYGPYTVSS